MISIYLGTAAAVLAALTQVAQALGAVLPGSSGAWALTILGGASAIVALLQRSPLASKQTPPPPTPLNLPAAK